MSSRHLGCRCCTESSQSGTGSVVINAMLPRRRCLKAQKKTLAAARLMMSLMMAESKQAKAYKLMFIDVRKSHSPIAIQETSVR